MDNLETTNTNVMPDDKAKWYVLHTYSGYETMVKDNLEMVFRKNNLEHRLFDIIIPTEDVIEEKNGKRKTVKRRKFPCYVFIKMDYDNSLWHMITKTRGVTGFVGPQGRALALTDDEIKRMRLEENVIYETDLNIGDPVRFLDGALTGRDGVIESIDRVNGKVKVEVSLFGRTTLIEIELNKIEKL